MTVIVNLSISINVSFLHFGQNRGNCFSTVSSRTLFLVLFPHTGHFTHSVSLGTDVYGNITRIDNAIDNLETRLNQAKADLENTKTQLETAKIEVEKPFAQEEELKQKMARLNELNALLNVDKRENEIVGGEPDEGEQPTKNRDRDCR